MYRQTAHHPSKKRSYKAIIFGLFFMLIGIPLIWFLFFGDSGLPKGRYIVTLLGDPLEVAMFDPSRNHWTTLELSVDTHVSGVKGLGYYRLDALWDVAATESSPSAIIMETLTHELGIPITRYIARKENVWQKRSYTERPFLFDVFSILRIGSYLNGQWETNIPLKEFIGISRKTWGLNPETVTRFSLTSGNGLSKKQAPDSSEYLQFDQRQFDAITGDAYEDVSIRQEGIRVAVYNTTQKAFLGSEAARILSKLGTNVVQVGNESTPVEKCLMLGKKPILLSYTAAIVQELFGCDAQETTEDGQADLLIKIGTEYAQKYFISE